MFGLTTNRSKRGLVPLGITDQGSVSYQNDAEPHRNELDRCMGLEEKKGKEYEKKELTQREAEASNEKGSRQPGHRAPVERANFNCKLEENARETMFRALQ